MTTRRQAAKASSGWIFKPSVSQEEAGRPLGVPIPDEAWKDIELAFARFGAGMDDLSTSRPNDAEKDLQSWHQQKRVVVSALDRAMDALDLVSHVDHRKLTRRRRQFVADAIGNYYMQTFGHSGGLNHVREIDNIVAQLARLKIFVERAEPLTVAVPTEATLRAGLIAAVHRILGGHGLPVTLSSKGATQGLSRFEETLLKLGIERGLSDRAFAMAVRRAVAKVGDA